MNDVIKLWAMMLVLYLVMRPEKIAEIVNAFR